MTSEDVEAGRKLQKLETQIEQAYQFLSDMEDTKARKKLKNTLRKSFEEYLPLAKKYKVPSRKIKDMTIIYNIHKR